MPLPRRSARPDEQAAVAARVRALLVPVRGGWTLPPDGALALPLPGVARKEVEPEVADPADAVSVPVAQVLTQPVPAEAARVEPVPVQPAWPGPVRPEPAPPEPARREPVLAEPARLQPARPEPALPEPALPEPALPEPALPEPVSPAVLPSVLDRLRAGRLDPGRRAVAGLALLGLLACLLAGGLVLRGRPQEVAAPAVERAGAPIAGASLPGADTPPAEVAEVVVAVAGKVRRPGLVRLPPGSRVDDAVRASGGLLPGASPGLLNLARKVVDGEQVLVGVDPPAGAAPAAGAGAAPAAGARVDLNTASASDLDALPGIGPVLAQRIVEHRTEHGPFRSVDQLREVSGIGEAKYASLKDRVAV